MSRDSFADGVISERRISFRRARIRIADMAAASLSLALLAPLLIVVVVILKINSPGPFLVRQWRHGYRNRPLLIRKFRTTFASGEKADFPTSLVSTLLHQTGIEDLPMLGNVLRGEMSIFGPAPSVHPDIALNDRKPGIIRWAELINSVGGPK